MSDMPPDSWPRARRNWVMGREGREAARWSEVFERPGGEGERSGFWRRWGWVVRMRRTMGREWVWIARRRRRDGSILEEAGLERVVSGGREWVAYIVVA